MNIPQIKSICLLAAFCLAASQSLHIDAQDPLPKEKPESVGISSRRLDQIAVALRAEIARKTMTGAVVASASETT